MQLATNAIGWELYLKPNVVGNHVVHDVLMALVSRNQSILSETFTAYCQTMSLIIIRENSIILNKVGRKMLPFSFYRSFKNLTAKASIESFIFNQNL